MRSGAEWYAREPVAYLGGVQGLSAKEHAVYAVALELIYLHGGSVNNDPGWIAGWIKDMGAHAVRVAIASLVEKKKLEIDGEQLTQKRAKTQAKTRENVRETRTESGRKGGIKSGKSRRENNKNKELDEPSGLTREEKRREEYIADDDDAGASTPDPPDEKSEIATEREQLLEAMDCDTSGITGPGGGMIGRMADMQMVQRWRDELGLTFEEVIGQVQEVMAKKRLRDPGPPSTFKYFEEAMRRYAGEKADRPKLTPITGVQSNEQNGNRKHNGSAKTTDADATTRAIAFAGAARRTPSADSF